MATLDATQNSALPETQQLSNAQTGNGASTNVIDRGASLSPVLVKVTTAIGATPTVTIAIEGSPDLTNWFAAPYADSATPTTVSVATFVVTTATTLWKTVQPNFPCRYLRLSYTANTNVTITTDVWVP